MKHRMEPMLYEGFCNNLPSGIYTLWSSSRFTYT